MADSIARGGTRILRVIHGRDARATSKLNKSEIKLFLQDARVAVDID
jgi:hypothetical protein